MAENAAVFQNLQLGVESTPGTAVAATKILQDLRIMTDIESDIDFFTPSGKRYPTVVQPNKEWSSGKIEGKPGYQTLPYIYCSLIKNVTPTRNIPSTGLSYLWTFSPTVNAEDTVKTYTFERGNAVRAEKYPYSMFNGIELSGDREDVKISGETFGQRATDGITLTSLSAGAEVTPILLFPTQGDVYLSDTQAGLDSATPMARVFEWQFKLTDMYGQVWPVRSSDTSFAAHVPVEPKAEAKLRAAWDSESAPLLTQMRAGAKKFLRIKYTGALIETTYNYFHQIDMCVAISKPDGSEDSDGLFTRGWELQLLHDAAWGKPFEIKVQNTLSAL